MKQSGMLTFLSMILMSVGPLAAQEDSVHDFQDTSAYQAWHYDMYRSLLSHADINVRITAAVVLGDAYDTIDNQLVERHEIDAVTLLNLIQKGAKNPQTNWQSLMFIKRLCQHKTLQGSCDDAVLNERLISLRPDNFSSYLPMLELARQSGQEQAINAILKRMSETTQATYLFRVDGSMKAAINDYVMTHKIPAALPEMIDAAEQQNIDLEELLVSMELMSLKFTGNYLLTNFDFNPLPEVCQTQHASLTTCEVIAELLTNNSDSFIYEFIGQGLLEQIYVTTGRTAELDALEHQQKRRQQYIMCLSKVMQPAWEHSLTDLQFIQAFTSSDHEGKTMETLAQLSYQHLLLTDPELTIDPATCGLRHQKSKEGG